jgi:hypothetical protein
VGINCRLHSAPVADLRRWIADPGFDLPAAPRRILNLRKDWDVRGSCGSWTRGAGSSGRDGNLGPTRVLWPAAVRSLRDALAPLTDAEVGRRMALARGSGLELPPRELPILLGLVRELRAFVKRAATARHGMTVSYS